MRIPIAKPSFGTEERDAVCDVLAGSSFSNGPRTAAFERAFADHHDARHGIATSSGATALTAALLAHGIGAGDEVIVPSFSFFATAASVCAAGAKPVFADIEPDTYCLAAAAAERAITPRTRAILVVHLYGLPADLPAFEELCHRHDLCLLQDAAQAHGAAFGERRIGSFGTAAFSFYASKNMTTLEGGMVLTNDATIARRARMLRNHGRDRVEHELLGTNFRMTEIAAAIGLVQLARLPEWTARRIEHARFYDEALENVLAPRVPLGRTHVYHQYTIRVPAHVRDPLVSSLNESGVDARVYYRRPIHTEPAMAPFAATTENPLPETERACREVVSLPVFPTLTGVERAHVAALVNACLAPLVGS